MDDKSKNILRQAIKKYGEKTRKIHTIEEMTELGKEICKDIRERGNIENITEEIADVEIMIAQLKMVYDVETQVEEVKAEKIAALETRIQNNERW